MTNVKVYQGSTMTKMLKSAELNETRKAKMYLISHDFVSHYSAHAPMYNLPRMPQAFLEKLSPKLSWKI